MNRPREKRARQVARILRKEFLRWAKTEYPTGYSEVLRVAQSDEGRGYASWTQDRCDYADFTLWRFDSAKAARLHIVRYLGHQALSELLSKSIL